jgi:hypothetical protein
MRIFVTLTIFITFILLPCFTLAQLERKRVIKNSDVELTFMSTKNINLYTAQHLEKGELQYSIMHTFGQVNSKVENFWGLDFGANVRLNFEYGLNDKLTIGVGRSSQDKVYTFSARTSLLREKSLSGSPISISLNTLLGITTIRTGFLANSYSFGDRLHFSGSLPITKMVSKRLSLLVTPIVTHFNRTGTELSLTHPDIQTYFGLGNGFRYTVLSHSALTFQSVIPVKDIDRLKPNFAIGYDIETGGHVFQIFFTTSPSVNESYLMAADNGNISKREFRLGFNINRLFKLH